MDWATEYLDILLAFLAGTFVGDWRDDRVKAVIGVGAIILFVVYSMYVNAQ